jgi:hypothetical protein
MNSPITSAAVTLAGLLGEADFAGLPMPYAAVAYEDKVSLQVWPDEHAAWAAHLNVPITPGDEPLNGKRHDHITTERDGIPLVVTALVPVEAGVA